MQHIRKRRRLARTGRLDAVVLLTVMLDRKFRFVLFCAEEKRKEKKKKKRA